MTGKRLLSVLFLCLSGLFVSLLLSQCGTKQPKVENKLYSTPYANHLRFTDACASCHEYRRMPPTKDLVTVPHGFGRECAECHQYATTGTPSWTPKFYAHNPKPAACLGCHSLPGEATKFNANAHAPNQTLRGDCAGCHQFGTKWKVN